MDYETEPQPAKLDAEKQLKSQKTAAARSKIKGSPRETSRLKTQRILNWIYRWGWASAGTICKLGGGLNRGLPKKMVAKGLLVETKTENGGATKNVPAKIFTLSLLGLSEAESTTKELIEYKEINPYKVNQSKLKHDYIAQNTTLDVLLNKGIIAYRTERQLASSSELELKQADIIWMKKSLDENVIRIGVEIELSAKWGGQLDHFIKSVIKSLDKNSNGFQYEQTVIISDSEAIIARYNDAFKPGAQFGNWRKNERGRYEKFKCLENQIQTVPGWVTGKILFKLI